MSKYEELKQKLERATAIDNQIHQHEQAIENWKTFSGCKFRGLFYKHEYGHDANNVSSEELPISQDERSELAAKHINELKAQIDDLKAEYLQISEAT